MDGKIKCQCWEDCHSIGKMVRHGESRKRPFGGMDKEKNYTGIYSMKNHFEKVIGMIGSFSKIF